MAGRFEGVSDMEWRLFEDISPPQHRRSAVVGCPMRRFGQY